MSRQRGPDYQALKILDLSGVAETEWRQATRCRFRDCNAYEVVYGDLKFDPRHCRRLWNAVSSLASIYRLPLDNLDAVLRENAEEFARRHCHALMPAPARQVYVNRFAWLD